MQKDSPKVSVLMSVYNGEKYLKEAMDSILSQTFTDFEFLIINDASTDRSVEIIHSYSDERIRVIHNEKNLGLTASLNLGLEECKGEYIVRMDCDDISLENRLSRQVEYMERRQDIGICGSWVKSFGDLPGRVLKYPEVPEEVKCKLLFHSALAHPSVMLRKSALNQYGLRYNPAYKRAQDYDLWVRAAEYLQISNIPQVLLLHRIHSAQVSVKRGDDQQDTAYAVRRYQIKKIIENVSDEEIDIHQSICNRGTQTSREFVLQAESWLKKLKAVRISSEFDESVYQETIGHMWFIVCTTSASLGFWAGKKYFSSELKRISKPGFMGLIKFFTKISLHRN